MRQLPLPAEPLGQGERHTYYAPSVKMMVAKMASFGGKSQDAIADLFGIQHRCLVSKWQARDERWLVRRAIAKLTDKAIN